VEDHFDLTESQAYEIFHWSQKSLVLSQLPQQILTSFA
jgi:hypothetical protein